ncbi:beta-ribofuranosylaminobenzene 5'-phosphate synthase [Archaeoglobus veneficus]|uniref:Beta-ribofuranosylaminobenzene 5'-phosphate synthase n=1 Tax=Archaeoglobus veneficus (strain DSM 11195 / SNP6) TaxID=693661 RepID=F2KN21_ARCVS|nr:beta-ribofuranosylaminobenzene 5'-phosphate synthase [Archaeoglobus veneficus]AEA47297.1 beta-ribofuranosylaminobenzene 5'-phosphate synthase family [Archaeoglobus veneficus SNP6]
MPEKVRIRTPSRLHVTLIDLNGSLGRIDGGVGISVNEPFVEVIGRRSDEVSVEGGINADRFRNIALKLEKHFGFSATLEVKSDYRPHIGLGSGTQISLAVATIYATLAGKKMSVRELASLVGRGGTSGIGVAAFEYGGFIVDGGHSTKVKPSFLPSSASKAPPPPVIARHDFPDWKIVIAIPELTGAHGRAEVDLFSKNCPIPLEEVRELSHIILMQMLPAVVEEDLDAFCKALNRIQQIGFKRIEVERYDVIKDLLSTIDCAGMSSTGPAIFAVTDTDAKSISKEIKSFFSDAGFDCESIITRARNRGAEVELL